MNKLFFWFSKYFTSNLIGILIGVIVGIAVNLYTNQITNNYYLGAIIPLFVAVVFLIFIIALNEKFEKQFHIKKRDPNNKNLTDDQIWKKAIADKSNWKTLYFVYFLAVFISFGFSFNRIKEVNKKLEQMSIKKEHSLPNLNSISDSIDELNKKLYMLSDSIENLKTSVKLNKVRTK